MNEWCKEGVKANGEAESGFKQIGIRKATYFSAPGLTVVLPLCHERLSPHPPILLPSTSSLKGGTRLS